MSIGVGSFQNPSSGLDVGIDPRRLRVGDGLVLVLAENEVQFVTGLIEGVIRISIQKALCPVRSGPKASSSFRSRSILTSKSATMLGWMCRS